jgi:nicotinamide-nucleotide adenylyltransferase
VKKTLGFVARFRPLHLAHAAVLDALCESADEVAIGIGSSNRYDGRNPFTAVEAADMIDAYLGARAGMRVVDVPDLGNGPKWRVMVRELLGPLDLFVTANPYVRDLMTGIYTVAHPRDLVSRERHVAVSGELVRRAMARGAGWRDLVPREVAELLHERGLVERFRREFGLSTLALEMNGAPSLAPTAEEEKSHVLLGR